MKKTNKQKTNKQTNKKHTLQLVREETALSLMTIPDCLLPSGCWRGNSGNFPGLLINATAPEENNRPTSEKSLGS